METVLLAVGGIVEDRARPDGEAVEPAIDAAPPVPDAVGEPLLEAVPDPTWQPPSWEQVVTEHGTGSIAWPTASPATSTTPRT